MTNETATALEELRSGDSVAIWEAAKLLINANDAGAIPHLLALLIEGTTDERRVAAASVLGTLRVAEASPTLRGILDSGTRLRPYASKPPNRSDTWRIMTPETY